MNFLKLNWNKFFGIILGIVIIFVGISFENDNADSYSGVSSLTFGADFYTEVHDAAAKAATRTGEVHDVVAKGISTGLIVFGFFVICLFLAMLKMPEKKTEQIAAIEFEQIDSMEDEPDTEFVPIIE